MGGAAVLLAIVAIGCGSGGDTTEVALTKAQFIKTGDAICRAALNKRSQAVSAWLQQNKKGKEAKELSNPELGHLYVTVALPPIREASEDLAELNPPAGDHIAEKFVELFTKAVEGIEENPTSVFEHRPYRSADLLGQEYGFKDCFF